MVKQLTTQDALGGSSGGSSGWSFSSATVSSGGTISLTANVTQQVIFVEGNAGAVTANLLPLSGSVPNGAVIRLIGTNDSNTVELVNNDVSGGCILNGNITLGAYDAIEFQYFSSLARYVEISRNS